MSHKEIEIILMRQLASYLATPVFLVDPKGNLIYYNEPAEPILGRRFEETGEMTMEEWATAFTPTDEKGTRLPPESLPLIIALTTGSPSNSKFWIKGLDQVLHLIEVTAFPLIGQANRHLGAAAIFWELEK